MLKFYQLKYLTQTHILMSPLFERINRNLRAIMFILLVLAVGMVVAASVTFIDPELWGKTVAAAKVFWIVVGAGFLLWIADPVDDKKIRREEHARSFMPPGWR